MKNEGTSVDICPFLHPNPHTTDGRYIQPANVDKDLSLTTTNTVVWYAIHIHCVIVCNCVCLCCVCVCMAFNSSDYFQ